MATTTTTESSAKWTTTDVTIQTSSLGRFAIVPSRLVINSDQTVEFTIKTLIHLKGRQRNGRFIDQSLNAAPPPSATATSKPAPSAAASTAAAERWQQQQRGDYKLVNDYDFKDRFH